MLLLQQVMVPTLHSQLSQETVEVEVEILSIFKTWEEMVVLVVEVLQQQEQVIKEVMGEVEVLVLRQLEEVEEVQVLWEQMVLVQSQEQEVMVLLGQLTLPFTQVVEVVPIQEMQQVLLEVLAVVEQEEQSQLV
jgi:hypothetical protein